MNAISINSGLRRMAAGVAATVLCSAVANAHHSFAAFDNDRLVALSGTVQEVVWANPHVWVYLDVTKADGAVERWAIEGSSPNMLIRWGWNAGDIAVGDKVTVDARPAKDGKHLAAIQTLFLANGKAFSDPVGQRKTPLTGGELAEGPKGVPTKPQGEVYK